MEVSEKDIETLRKIVNGELDREVDYAAIIAANKTLDRLSPPAPEVDEATRIWREMRAKGAETLKNWKSAADYRAGRYVVTPWMDAEIAYLRQVLASKDGEIEEWKAALRHAHDLIGEADNRTWKAESELAAISAAIGTTEFMDPPDGGSPSLAEQVGRMQSELAALRAEHERLTRSWAEYRPSDDNYGYVARIIDGSIHLDPFLKGGPLNAEIARLMKAAERNTAEPAPETLPPGTNAGAVEVTEEDIGWATSAAQHVCAEADRPAAIRLLSDACRRIRTEAEARGRREALDFGGSASELYFKALREKWSPVGFFSELKCMMTGGK